MNKPPLPPRSRPDYLAQLPVAALLLAMFLACCFPLADTDFWWHLKTGEMIWANGELPQTDWFTFMDPEARWIDLHWGFQLLITGLYHLGGGGESGATLVVIVKALVLTAALGFALTAAGRNLPGWVRAWLGILPAITISGRGYERPEMLSMLFLGLLLWVFERLPERPRLIWVIPPLMCLWINCHALFVLGLVVCGCAVVDKVARTLATGRFGLEKTGDEPDPRTWIYAGAATVVACFLNPYFEEGVLFPLVLYRKFSSEQALYADWIGEFQQPVVFFSQFGFANLYLNAEMLLWLLAALSFLGLACFRRISLYRLLLFIGFSKLAWEASRNTNIFSAIAVMVLAGNLGDILTMFRGEASSTVNTGWHSRWQRPPIVITTTLLLIGSILIVTGDFGRWAGEGRLFGFGQRPNWFMHEAARFAGQPGFPDHAIISHNGQAAVYLYHNGPNRRVFMDARLEVSSIKTVKMYRNILNLMKAADPAWEPMLRDAEGRLPVVLLSRQGAAYEIAGMAQNPHWRLVYADTIGAVFLETRHADQLKLPAADPAPLFTRPPR